jgi:hypothetical protein
MHFLSYIYRNGLWISLPLFAISAAFLSLFILNVKERGSFLCSESISVPISVRLFSGSVS